MMAFLKKTAIFLTLSSLAWALEPTLGKGVDIIPEPSEGGANPKYELISPTSDVKCAAVSGEDPKYKFIANTHKDDCEDRCAAYTEGACYGYSHSGMWGSCLLWLEPLSLSKFQENKEGWRGCWIRKGEIPGAGEFDCSSGEVFSEEKAAWCCDNKEIGCTPPPTTSSNSSSSPPSRPSCEECTLDYEPVCTFDGAFYENPCLAQCAGITDFEHGECEGDCECYWDYSY